MTSPTSPSGSPHEPTAATPPTTTAPPKPPAASTRRLHRLLALLVAVGPDLVMVGVFSVVFLGMLIAYGAKVDLVESTVILPSLMAAVILAISFFVGARKTFGARARGVLRDWLPFIFLNFLYENLRQYTGVIRQVPIDPLLDRADRALFGVSPTLWMKHVQRPLLTDFMSFSYDLYFVLPLAIVGLLYWRRRRDDFRELALALVLCIYIGFLGFIIFPAGPPRFYAPMMAVFDPPHLRSYFGLWEWSQGNWDSVNPVKIYASFPSLHCGLAMVTVIYSWRYSDLLPKRRLLFLLIAPWIVSLWFSTVYLRHHWVVDVFAGWTLGVLSFVLARYLRGLFERMAQRVAST